MSDVPGEVYTALTAAYDLYPVGPPTGDADRAAWWEQTAQTDEVIAQAYERLHEWAIADEQPPAVTAAIGDAAMLRQKEARQSRAEAARARRREAR